MQRILTLIFALSSLSAISQHEFVESADFNYNHHFYKEALKDYQKALKNTNLSDEDRLHSKQQMAYTYHHLFDYENAESAYATLLKDTANKDLDALLNYGHVLRNNAKYEEALATYLDYSDKTGKATDVMFYTLACEWAINNADLESDYLVSLTNIETGGRSFGVAMYNDGLIYSKSQKSDFKDHTTFYDISFATKTDSITFNSPVKLKGSMNHSFYEGAPSLTADNKLLYYTGNASERSVYRERNRKKKEYHLSKEGINILNIYVADNADTAWINSKELPFNSLEYSCTHPSISKDGKTLYFVSNMPGGEGGYDVYVSTKTDTSWSKPVNLGPQINTKDNEMTPFILKDTLFFSSKGNMGFGGADIYYALLKDGKVESVKNFGHPFNTSKDDFGLVITEGQQSGYLSSNREGTHGYDHIYYFEKDIPEFPDTIRGFTINKITGKPIPFVKLTVEPEVQDIANVKQTGADGSVEIILPKHQEYVVTFYAEGYEPVEIEIPAENRENVIAKFGELELIPIAVKDVVIEIDEIYFEYDKADIRPESEPALTKILEYLNFYPEVRVELSAHTDSRGSDSYNKRLSQKRAESTVKYLVEKGIKVERLVPAGYGETKLRNKCKNGVKCTDEEHMFNRRVELKVL